VAPRIDNDTRDMLASAFRERMAESREIAPFLHQRRVWAASDGMELTDVEDPNGVTVRLEDGVVIRVATRARPAGRARFLADLGAFKIGKSYGAALWASGFAAVPGARVSLVGLEYDICEPEFHYLCEFLLSEPSPGVPPFFKAVSLADRARDGKMWIDLPNGARYEARSWERKDTLKGKEIDAYVYCEAYQLPGIECFTGFSQNLRARRGYAYFATTPDRPWIKSIHQLGWNHGGPEADPEWHCTCNVSADVNPFTFDPVAKRRDEKLMTREKFEIHYNGQLGDFVGHVFNYHIGSHQFTATSHPHLFRGGEGKEHFVLPDGWTVLAGADTGTFYSALIVAFDPDGNAFVLEEFPNYDYVAGAPERDENLSIPRWAHRVQGRMAALRAGSGLWADANAQFKGELRNYGLALMPERSPVEARTEITREYFEHGRIFLAPWLKILPFELENAAWPEEATASGKFARVKDRDHTLDPLEHILARRPLGRRATSALEKGSWALGQGYKPQIHGGNVHLGAH
jgi:hypothetical protein